MVIFCGGVRQLPLFRRNAIGGSRKVCSMNGDFLTIFEHLSNRLEVGDMELVAVVAQKIWLRRNKVVFGGAVLDSTCLVKSTKETLEAFHL